MGGCCSSTWACPKCGESNAIPGGTVSPNLPVRCRVASCIKDARWKCKCVTTYADGINQCTGKQNVRILPTKNLPWVTSCRTRGCRFTKSDITSANCRGEDQRTELHRAYSLNSVQSVLPSAPVQGTEECQPHAWKPTPGGNTDANPTAGMPVPSAPVQGTQEWHPDASYQQYSVNPAAGMATPYGYRRLAESPQSDGPAPFTLASFACGLGFLTLLGLVLARLRCGKTRAAPGSRRSDAPAELDLEAEWNF